MSLRQRMQSSLSSLMLSKRRSGGLLGTWIEKNIWKIWNIWRISYWRCVFNISTIIHCTCMVYYFLSSSLKQPLSVTAQHAHHQLISSVNILWLFSLSVLYVLCKMSFLLSCSFCYWRMVMRENIWCQCSRLSFSSLQQKCLNLRLWLLVSSIPAKVM